MAPSKNVLKRDLKKIENALDDSRDYLELPISQMSQSLLSKYITSLETSLQDISNARSDIWDITCDEDNQDKEDFSTLETHANSLYKDIQSLIFKSENLLSEIQNAQRCSTPSASATHGDGTQPQVKLPQIQLPTFHGAPEKFIEFYNSFDSLINGNSTLSGVQKLHYLRSALKGQAADVISSLELSEENFTVAWELLVQRYKCTSRIVDTHLHALFNLPSIPKFDNSNSVSTLHNELTKGLNALRALKIDTENWDPLRCQQGKER